MARLRSLDSSMCHRWYVVRSQTSTQTSTLSLLGWSVDAAKAQAVENGILQTLVAALDETQDNRLYSEAVAAVGCIAMHKDERVHQAILGLGIVAYAVRLMRSPDVLLVSRCSLLLRILACKGTACPCGTRVLD